MPGRTGLGRQDPFEVALVHGGIHEGAHLGERTGRSGRVGRGRMVRKKSSDEWSVSPVGSGW